MVKVYLFGITIILMKEILRTVTEVVMGFRKKIMVKFMKDIGKKIK